MAGAGKEFQAAAISGPETHLELAGACQKLSLAQLVPHGLSKEAVSMTLYLTNYSSLATVS